MTTPPPSAWIDPWPDGHIHPDAPRAAIWLAELAWGLSTRQASASEIAVATHLDIRTVKGVLEGTRWPTLHTLTALASYLRRATRTHRAEAARRDPPRTASER